MDLIIIGGGIGGLTLALAVHGAKAAQRIRIFEAAPDLHALGVGINLGPHAVKELSALGLQDALVAPGCAPQDYAFFTRHGQLVYREPWGLAAGHQWPHLSLHRGDLHQVLLDAVRDRIGAENFVTGHRCSAVEQDEALSRLFDDAALAAIVDDWAGWNAAVLSDTDPPFDPDETPSARELLALADSLPAIERGAVLGRIDLNVLAATDGWAVEEHVRLMATAVAATEALQMRSRLAVATTYARLQAQAQQAQDDRNGKNQHARISGTPKRHRDNRNHDSSPGRRRTEGRALSR